MQDFTVEQVERKLWGSNKQAGQVEGHNSSSIADLPQRKASTLRFTLGSPRSLKTVDDGRRAFFLRSRGPEDLENCLWMSAFDQVGNHQEILLADPRLLQADGLTEEVSAEERARRERAREGSQGIVAYSTDSVGRRVVFVLAGKLWLVEVDSDGLNGSVRMVTGDCPQQLSETHSIVNPCLSPDGQRVAYTTGREIVVVCIGEKGQADTVTVALTLPETAGDNVRLGLAEFVAGEEMDRYEGFWWSPQSDALLVEAFDSSAEPVWYMSDPAKPWQAPTAHPYPQALTSNVSVGLFMLALHGDGSARQLWQVDWDRKRFEYLAVVRWQKGCKPLILVQNRRQTEDQILSIDTPDLQGDCGHETPAGLLDFSRRSQLAQLSTQVLSAHSNPQWLDLIPGLPAFTADGQLLEACIDSTTDTTRLALNGRMFTPAGCQLRELLDVGDKDVLAVVSSDPRSFDLMSFGYDGSVSVLNPGPGVWTASRSGQGIVVSGRTMQDADVSVWHALLSPGCPVNASVCGGKAQTSHGVEQSVTITSLAAQPGFVPKVDFVRLGKEQIFAAVTRPSADSPWADEDHLPILLKPYGGPGFQQVVFSQSYYWESQWWADQGFIVLTADGHGTTGRGPAWDRAIFENMAEVTLDDQVAAVQALPDLLPEADVSRVAMIGWSYGGFLSALAVLRAPDVVHAACAGAPPTDWTLYDTHYTERYLGLDPEVYERNSIIKDASQLRRPLMLIHGFADDNVSVANTLLLSQALMAAGKSHTVLPLTGITHMTNDPVVSEHLLVLQRNFLYQALGIQARG